MLFGGTIPHYFYTWLEHVVPEEAAFPVAKKLFLERLIYSPLYQAFTLYILARLEGKSHNDSVKQLQNLYWIVLTSSWKYLTIIQLLNLSVVPPVVSFPHFGSRIVNKHKNPTINNQTRLILGQIVIWQLYSSFFVYLVAYIRKIFQTK